MKKLTCTLLLSFATLGVLGAAEATPTNVASAPEAAPVLELKNKSSFTLEETSRNPFWPIGWKPAPKQATNSTTEQVGPEISPNSFLVSSITVDVGGRFAIINGKAMGEGQVFGLQLGGQTYQITVKAIQDGQVILTRRGEEIAVPLRRR
jgi:hypothetical protein